MQIGLQLVVVCLVICLYHLHFIVLSIIVQYILLYFVAHDIVIYHGFRPIVSAIIRASPHNAPSLEQTSVLGQTVRIESRD